MPWRLGAKQIHYVEFFSKFKLTSHHLLEKKNSLGDALSQLPQHESQRE